MSNAKPRRYASLADVRKKEFLGHPVGLWALFTTEMWERFCYYGMRALLVLYLISTLTDSNPGFGWSEKDANKLYGWFTGLVYLFPLLGGYIADRFLGRHRSVLLGGALMAAGEFCLFYTEYFRDSATSTITPSSAPAAFWCFMFGLFLITVGNGFFKPCISVMVGDLYEKNDPRRDDAFNLFYMGINVGAFLAPFVAGSVGENISWHWGFLTACVGMVFGLCTYSFLRPKYLGPIGMKTADEEAKETAEATAANDGAATLESASTTAVPTAPQSKLTKIEIDRVAVILTLTFFCVAFWSVFEQAGTSLNIFAKKETNRQVPQSVGQNLPGFLANQDELDAKIATKELQAKLIALQNALVATENKQLTSDVATNAASKDFDAARAALDSASLDDALTQELGAALTDLVAANENAATALKKANEARDRAGLTPLDLNASNFERLLENGENEQRALQTRVDELFSDKAAELVNPTPEELASLRANLEKDVAKQNQADFLAEEAKKVDRKTAIYTFPTTWYQSVNPLAVVIFAPLFNVLWGFLRRRKLEPSTPVKFGVGLVMLSVAYLFMIGGALQSTKTGGNAGAYWLLFTYVFCTWGELCLSPVGLSMVSRLAPARFASLLMGVWFLSSAVAGYLSGYLAAVLGSNEAGGEGRVSFFFGDRGGMADFFLIMTLAPFVAGAIVFVVAPKLRKMMHENE